MNLFKKTELSFDKFDQTIKRYLAKTFNNLGLEYTHTQIFGIIYDGIKGVMENIMFYQWKYRNIKLYSKLFFQKIILNFAQNAFFMFSGSGVIKIFQ